MTRYLLEDVPGKGKTYKVKSGDTVSAIARANGMTVDEIKMLNPSLDVDRISIGQIINLSSSNTNKPVPNQTSTTNADLTPIDLKSYYNFNKTEGGNLAIDTVMMRKRDNYYINKGVGLAQRQAAALTTQRENAGRITPHGNGAYAGYGYRGVRATPIKNVTDENKQFEYEYNTIFGKYDNNHWSNPKAQQDFLNANDPYTATEILNKFYVRPGSSVIQERTKLSRKAFLLGGMIGL